jgi:hypothetical protein
MGCFVPESSARQIASRQLVNERGPLICRHARIRSRTEERETAMQRIAALRARTAARTDSVRTNSIPVRLESPVRSKTRHRKRWMIHEPEAPRRVRIWGSGVDTTPILPMYLPPERSFIPRIFSRRRIGPESFHRGWLPSPFLANRLVAHRILVRVRGRCFL